MKIQIEEDKDLSCSSLEKITLISYQIKEGKEKKSYQAAIPKALEDVQLSDVKQAVPTSFSKPKLEYHFKTKDNEGNDTFIEVIDNLQAIPTLDGEIVVEAIPNETEVCFQIINDMEERFDEMRTLHKHGIIPISMKKSKTLKDVKNAIPVSLQKFLKNGESVKYFFDENKDEVGLVKKELILDSTEVPNSEEGNKMKCYIMVSKDLSKKLSLQKYLILTLVALLNLFVMVTLCFLIPYYLNQDKFALGLIAIPGFIFYLCGCLVSIIPLIYLPYYCSNSQIGGSQQDSTCTCQCHIKNTRK